VPGWISRAREHSRLLQPGVDVDPARRRVAARAREMLRLLHDDFGIHERAVLATRLARPPAAMRTDRGVCADGFDASR